MAVDSKALRRAMMVAKDIAASVSKAPLMRANGGEVGADDHPTQGYAPKPPATLKVDNPGGDWLQENREYSESRGYLPSGAPRSFGKVTATWRDPKSNDVAPVYLPVSMLSKIPGVMGEQNNVRPQDLDWLVDHMGKTGKLPKPRGNEYLPFITVDHRGIPFVSEGNHRIMAAQKLGWNWLPVEVRYFNGAEDVDGPLHPDRIKAMHSEHKAYGGDVDVKPPVIDPAKAIRRAMMIAKADGGATEKPVKVRKTAADFLPESLPDTSINSLTKAFTEGINEHMALSDKDRIQNSRAAKKVIASRNGSGALLAKNGKLMKTETGAGDSDPVELPDGRGIETTGLSLAPAFQVGKFNTCPNHASCKASCLGVTSGGNFMFGGGRDLDEIKGPRLAHLKNTLAMILHPKEFAVRLSDEITSAKQQAAANGNKLGVRLNVLSDIHPRAYEALIKAHPDVDFYDYTKLDSNPIAPNHHLTYSSTGTAQPAGVNGNMTDVDNVHQNWRRMRRRLDTGSNVAMAFSHGSVLPEFVHDLESGKKYQVVNGDDHDFRPMDRQAEGADGVIVGLKNKKAFGKEQEAHIDSNGFFTYYDPKIVKDPMGRNVVTNNTVQIAPQPGAKRMMTNDSEPEETQNG